MNANGYARVQQIVVTFNNWSKSDDVKFYSIYGQLKTEK